GIGHWALGIGHWALGIGHWALGIGLFILPVNCQLSTVNCQLSPKYDLPSVLRGYNQYLTDLKCGQQQNQLNLL
ncbi:MAG: hypothetical protein EAZ87_18290, partial [Nostocales cyanobacterium]